MDENFKVGNFICELRKEKGLSQTELGAMLNVTNKAVSRWETGRGYPESSLLLPLSEILGVTVDEILRGELSTSVVMLNTLPKETAPSIHTANNALAYRAAKKLLIRDSLIVIPLMLFTVLWLVLRLGFHVDFAPGGDHSSSMIANLIIPLFVIGFGQLVYASFLVTDTIRIKKDAVFLKILAVIGVWFAVMYLFPVVYIRRVAVYFKRVSDFKNNKETSHL